MKVLNGFLGAIISYPDLKFIIVEGRIAKNEKTIKDGHPTLLVYALETTQSKIAKMDGMELIVLVEFVVVYRKDMNKAFTLQTKVYTGY